MRIALLNSSTTYWLAGNPAKSEREHTSAADLDIDEQPVTQEVRNVRAAAGRVIDRGNIITTLSFATVRQFATLSDAEEFMTDHLADFPRTGTLILRSDVPGGSPRLRYIANAVVSPPRRRQTGVSVFLTYQARGGVIATTVP